MTCKTCKDHGIVYTIVKTSDAYRDGWIDYEATEETYCDCPAGDASRAETAAAMAEWRRSEAEAERAAIAAGVEYIPF
jgi:hypothetical protein